VRRSVQDTRASRKRGVLSASMGEAYHPEGPTRSDPKVTGGKMERCPTREVCGFQPSRVVSPELTHGEVAGQAEHGLPLAEKAIPPVIRG
jgi:hypothetical protein